MAVSEGPLSGLICEIGELVTVGQGNVTFPRKIQGIPETCGCGNYDTI